MLQLGRCIILMSTLAVLVGLTGLLGIYVILFHQGELFQVVVIQQCCSELLIILHFLGV